MPSPTEPSDDAAIREQQRLALLGRMAGALAHDFNNVLMTVATGTEVLRRQLAGRAEAERPVSALQRAVQNGSALTRQVQAFAQRRPGERQRADVGALLGELSALLQTALGSRVPLTIDAVAGGGSVDADPAEVEAALVDFALALRSRLAAGAALKLAWRADDDAAELSAELGHADGNASPASALDGLGAWMDALPGVVVLRDADRARVRWRWPRA